MMVPVPQPQTPLPNRDRKEAALQSAEAEAMLYCPVCSAKLESRKCKLFCARCGYYMSCADYY
jgi:hypothetical protein